MRRFVGCLSMTLLGGFGFACGENQTPYANFVLESPTLCLPDLNGELSADEFPLLSEGSVEYAIANDQTVGYRLGKDSEGVSVWDFSTPIEGSQTQSISVLGMQSLGDTWYGSLFPEAQWAIANDEQETTVGLYTFDEHSLSMLGLVSPDNSETQRIVYDAPVSLMRFPMSVGDVFVSEGVIDEGVSNGLPFSGVHRYSVSVGERGELWLPTLRFLDVYRVDTLLEVEPTIGDTFLVRQRSFYSECFGELVRLQSQINAEDSGFTNVAEIRVLSVQ